MDAHPGLWTGRLWSVRGELVGGVSLTQNEHGKALVDFCENEDMRGIEKARLAKQLFKW